MAGDRWTVRNDDYGFPCAIEFDMRTMLHIVPGTVRNEEGLPVVLTLLNLAQRLQDALIYGHGVRVEPALSPAPTGGEEK